MKWHHGQKIVCVESGRSRLGYGYGDEIHPIKNEIYTIREIFNDWVHITGFLTFHLEEIINPPREYYEGVREITFAEVWFRPLITIDMFMPTDKKIILNKEKELEKI